MFFLLKVFTSWITDIVFVVLFASFLELLLPNSSMQRFIRVIMGLFIMMAILNPIINVLQTQLAPIQVPALSGNMEQTRVILNHGKDAVKEREQLSSELYKKELAKQMNIMIMALDGVADAKVVITTDSDNHAVNKIKKVMVYVTPGSKNISEKVEKVSIGKPAEGRRDKGGEVEDKITRLLLELYQIPKEIIEIKIVRT